MCRLDGLILDPERLGDRWQAVSGDRGGMLSQIAPGRHVMIREHDHLRRWIHSEAVTPDVDRSGGVLPETRRDCGQGGTARGHYQVPIG